MTNDWTGGNPFLGQNNPFLQQNIDATMGDVTRNYNQQVKPNTEASMVNSGSFGNSGLAQLQGEQQRQLGDTLGKVSSGMRMQDYGQQQNMYQWDQNFNRGLFNDGVSQNQQNFNNYRGLMGDQNQFNQQEISNAATVQNAPLGYQQQFANQANGAGGLGGTSSGGTTMPGSPVMGAMGGWGLGGQVGRWMNQP